MAVTQVYPNGTLRRLGEGEFDLANDSFELILLASTFAPDRDADETQADVEADEIAVGGGYTGAISLTAQSWTQDNANDRVLFDFADVSIANSTITARYAAIYQQNGGASSANPLLVILDFGADQTTDDSTFEIRLAALGLFALQQA